MIFSHRRATSCHRVVETSLMGRNCIHLSFYYYGLICFSNSRFRLEKSKQDFTFTINGSLWTIDVFRRVIFCARHNPRRKTNYVSKIIMDWECDAITKPVKNIATIIFCNYAGRQSVYRSDLLGLQRFNERVKTVWCVTNFPILNSLIIQATIC